MTDSVTLTFFVKARQQLHIFKEIKTIILTGYSYICLIYKLLMQSNTQMFI